MSYSAEYYRLAQEVMEPVLTVAGKRLGQAIEEIHVTQIKPMQDEIERLRAIRDELVAALDVLLRYVDEEAEDGMMQCVETQLARDTLAKARGEQT